MAKISWEFPNMGFKSNSVISGAEIIKSEIFTIISANMYSLTPFWFLMP